MLKLTIAANLEVSARARWALETLCACLGLVIDPEGLLEVTYSEAPPSGNATGVWVPYRPVAWLTANDAAQPTTGDRLVSMGRDLPAAVFRALTFDDENRFPRDAHDRAQPVGSLDVAGTSWVPPYLADLVAEFEDAVEQAARAARLPLFRLEPWPEGRPMAVMLSHDVEAKSATSTGLKDKLRAAFRGGLAGLVDRAKAAMEPASEHSRTTALCELERARGVHATFFLKSGGRWSSPGLAAMDPWLEELGDTLLSQGHELAVLGSYEAYNQAPAYLAGLTAHRERFGASPGGVRNAMLRFSCPETWHAQATAGFAYDASLGYPQMPGFRGGLPWPLRPWDAASQGASSLVALPLSLDDQPLFEAAGADPALAWPMAERVLGAAHEVGGLVALRWHPGAFGQDPVDPREGVFRQVLDWVVAREAWVATGSEIAGWWSERSRVRASLVPDGHGGWRIRLDHPSGLTGLVLRVQTGNESARVPVGVLAGPCELELAGVATERECAFW